VHDKSKCNTVWWPVTCFYPRELAKLRGYTSCFVIAVAVAVAVAVAFDVAAAKRACSLVSRHCSKAAVRIRVCSLVSCHCSRVAA
jgi:hypothetical protein